MLYFNTFNVGLLWGGLLEYPFVLTIGYQVNNTQIMDVLVLLLSFVYRVFKLKDPYKLTGISFIRIFIYK